MDLYYSSMSKEQRIRTARELTNTTTLPLDVILQRTQVTEEELMSEGGKKVPYKRRKGDNRQPKVKKAGVSARILLMLLDCEEHLFEEFYDWAGRAIPPQIIARAFVRRFKNGDKKLQADMEACMEEGLRIILGSTLWSLERDGKIEVKRPEGIIRTQGARPAHDFRRCVLKITEKGFRQLFEPGATSWGKLVRELYSGLKVGELRVSIRATT